MGFLPYVAVAAIVYIFANGLYNLCFHPLRKVPGPFFARLTSWWIFTLEMRREPAMEIFRLHQIYGITQLKYSSLLLTDTRANFENFAKRSFFQ